MYYISMNIFSVLADPTRRQVFELIAKKGPLSASDIADNFQVSAPAISQHLKVLREANLVQVEKRAQQRIYRINPAALTELSDWTAQMTAVWNQRFDALEQVLEAEKKKLQTQPDEKDG
jgi:DNA-binding transcriptional ArsR family regulator